MKRFILVWILIIGFVISCSKPIQKKTVVDPMDRQILFIYADSKKVITKMSTKSFMRMYFFAKNNVLIQGSEKSNRVSVVFQKRGKYTDVIIRWYDNAGKTVYKYLKIVVLTNQISKEVCETLL